MKPDLREALRSMLTLRPDGAESPPLEISNKQSNDLLIASFSLAVRRALGEDPSIDSIQKIVAEIRGTYVQEENLQPVQAEAVVRALNGETELITGLPYTEMAKTQLSVTYGILQLLDLKGDAFEDFLNEAVELAEDLAGE